MTQTALMDRIRATSSAITSQVSGELVAWHVKASQKVGRWETLATVRDHAGIVEITSDQPGTIKALMFPTGAQVEAGAAIAYFQPEASQTRQNGHHAAIPAPAPVLSAPPVQPSHDAPGTFQVPMPRRRGTLPAVVDLARMDVEELTIAETSNSFPISPEPAPLVKASPKATKRERVKHRGYYVLRRQEVAIKRVAARLSLDEHDPLSCNDSLIIRALIDQFESLPPGKQRALVEAYRMKEELSGEGAGWPRPGRPKGNKRA